MRHRWIAVAIMGLAGMAATASGQAAGPGQPPAAGPSTGQNAAYGQGQAVMQGQTAELGRSYGQGQAYGQGQDIARIGTINYIEGTVYAQGMLLHHSDVGSAVLKEGQMLTTGQGRAEILLTPGVFLRLDDNSAIKLVKPDLLQTQVELLQGKAAVEVDEIHDENDLEVLVGGVRTQMLKTGFYEFDATTPHAMVFKGKAAVALGNDKYNLIKGDHELALTDNLHAKPAEFNPTANEDDLYRWSKLRSQYLAEANNELAQEYEDMPGFEPGWFWDPYGFDFTYIGMGPFWSPFGFGFFPPWYGGFYGGFYGRGVYGRGGYYGRGGFGGGTAHFGGGMHGGGARR